MLEEYKACLSRVTLLSREEEQALWKEYKEEEEIDARQRLIENYQPLVFKEAVKYGLQEAVTMDLIQEGTVGLMEAVERCRLLPVCHPPHPRTHAEFPECQ